MKTPVFMRLSFMAVAALMLFATCKKDGGGINIFSVQDDIMLGEQVAAEIANDPAQFPILSRSTYAAAYSHMDRITNEILDNAPLNYRNEFAWDVSIIHNDSVLNAFCTPGGYIYVYTGLIKFLQSEDQLAGVMGHEIAHADLRHSTDQLTRVYGITLMLDIVLGENQGTLSDIAANLAFLKFGRNAEEQADEYSVRYLCPSEYDARGASRFFEALVAAGASSPPEFLSTHPDPSNRVEDITGHWDDLGCGVGGTFDARYADFIATLP